MKGEIIMGEKRVYKLDGLCCANCAAKIEKEVADLNEVLEASINLLDQKLTVLLHEGVTLVDDGLALLKQIIKIVNRHEPSVRVQEDNHEKITNNIKGNVNLDKETTDTEDINIDSHTSLIKNKKQPLYAMLKYLVRICIVIALSAVLSVINVSESIKLAGFIIAYAIAGFQICFKAVRNIIRGQIFDENFLMAIASIGAFIIGDRLEAVSVLVFYDIGEMLQDMAVNRSRRNIEELMDIRPDYANKITGDSISVVSPAKIVKGDMILVKPGEKIPLDGVVVKGSSFVDTSALTGESVPRQVYEGVEVLAGTVNQNGVIEVRVTKLYTESAVSKILELVRNAGSKKAQSEKFITKFAQVYTPVVVLAAIGVAVIPPLLHLGAFDLWLYRALSFLIISCPCALVISIPLSYFGGIGGGARHGILVKGSNYLDALQQVDTVVFDKTGTLTKGVFTVSKLSPAAGVDTKELLFYAAIAEKNSNHPIAKSIISYYNSQYNTNAEKADSITEVAGQGVIAEYKKRVIYAGNDKLMKTKAISITLSKEAGSVVHVAVGSRYLGYIVISDVIKPESASAIESLKKLGIRHTVMLTGDRRETAQVVATQCKLDEYRAQLLPQDKVASFESYKNQAAGKGKIVFVGDGINDAPVLAGADIGIAMGGIGSDAAIEAADVVIMNDNPAKIATAIIIARKTKQIVIQNIVFALSVKLLIMILAFLGITSIWFAIFADVGVALLALLNAMRAMYIKQEK